MVQQAEAQVDHAGRQIDLPGRVVAAMDGPACQSVGGALGVIKQFLGATGENVENCGKKGHDRYSVAGLNGHMKNSIFEKHLRT